MLEIEVYGPLQPPPVLATWNPSDSNSLVIFSNGYLTAAGPGRNSGSTLVGRATRGANFGKYYCEVTIGSNFPFNDNDGIGFANSSSNLGSFLGNSASNSLGYFVNSSLNIEAWFNGAAQATYTFGNVAIGSVLQMALDVTNKLVWINVGGQNWNNNAAANPATGANGLSFSAINAGPYFPAFDIGDISVVESVTANFGASAYAFTPPSGFGNW